MNVNKSFFKYIAGIFLLTGSLNALAGTPVKTYAATEPLCSDTIPADSVSLAAGTYNAASEPLTQINRYDKDIRKYKNFWSSLVPSFMKVQFAGNMGLASVGFGWDYGKHHQWETDLFWGYLPKHDSKKSKMTFTVKQNYIPWHIPMKHSLSFEPLTTGLYINSIFGEQFWRKEPERYSKGYYGFSTKFRINIFLGQRLTLNLPHKSAFLCKSITAFYELSTCDLYVVSAFTNKYLDFADYVALSFGLKFQIL